MTQEERKDRVLAQRATDYYLLFSSLNAAKYAVAQIGTEHMQYMQKKTYNDLLLAIKTFLNTITARSNSADKALLEDKSFDHIATMATVFGYMNQIPHDQLDWFLQSVVNLVYESVKQQQLLNQNQKLI